jgi:Xaa-Pro aminopeptidase
MVISKDELFREKEQRMRKIDNMMSGLGLDAILFTSTAQQAYQVHVKYVANARLSTRRAFVFKEPGKEPALMLPMSGDKYTYPNKSWVDTESLHLGNMLPTVLGFIEKLPQKRPVIGWAAPGDIPHEIYSALTGTKAEFVDITNDFTVLRANKSEYEIALTKLASDLSVESFEDLIRRIEPGKTEWELIGGAVGFLSERGAEELLILTRSKKPFAVIGRPSDATLGGTDIFVYSAEFAGPGGYWTQIIRPVFMDKKTHPDAYDIWKVALEAEVAAADAARPAQ